ncbi:phosphopantetheine-binding protein, partial [Streptomyces sp. NPDC001450]
MCGATPCSTSAPCWSPRCPAPPPPETAPRTPRPTPTERRNMQDIDHSAVHIRSIVAGVLDLDPDGIEDDQDFIDFYRADSLNLIEVVAQVEKHYQVELPLQELHRARSVNGLRALLVRLKLLTGLKQICNHPAQFLKEDDPRLTGRSGKL